MKGAAMSELTISDFKSKYEPIGISMELKSQGQSAYETGKIGGHTPLYTDEQIQDYLSNQPQLTIPKSIADWLDKAFEEYSEEGRMVSTILTMQIIRNVSKRKDIEEWFMAYNIERLNLALAYLAGKALGVDLVKVVEG